METSKPWYLSKTVWGGLIAVVASLLHASGTDLSGAVQSDLTDAAANLAGAVGGLVAVYGRFAANASIGKP